MVLLIDPIETILEHLELLELHFAEIIADFPARVHLPSCQRARYKSIRIIRSRVVQIAQLEVSFEDLPRFLRIFFLWLQTNHHRRLPFHLLDLLNALVPLCLIFLPAVDRRDLDAGRFRDGALSEIGTSIPIATQRLSLDESAGQLQPTVARVTLYQLELYVIVRFVDSLETVADQWRYERSVVHVDHFPAVVSYGSAVLADLLQHVLGHVMPRGVRAVVVAVHILVIGRCAVDPAPGIGVGIIARHAGTHAAGIPVLMMMMVMMVTTDFILRAVRAAWRCVAASGFEALRENSRFRLASRTSKFLLGDENGRGRGFGLEESREIFRSAGTSGSEHNTLIMTIHDRRMIRDF